MAGAAKTLGEDFLALPAAARRTVQVILCEAALASWRRFAAEKGRVEYVDSVVGMGHEVDFGFLADALTCVRGGDDGSGVWDRYGEPIAAMQDEDLEFPEPVQFAYYAINKLFRKVALGHDMDDWLIVNQALSSETDQDRWGPMLQRAMERARQSNGD